MPLFRPSAPDVDPSKAKEGEGAGRRSLRLRQAAQGPPVAVCKRRASPTASPIATGNDESKRPKPELQHLHDDSHTPRRPEDFLPVTSPTFMAAATTPFAGCHYLAGCISPSQSSEWYDALLALPHWYRPTLKLYGREITQSRSIAAYSKVEDLKLRYSGQEVTMEPWPPVLLQMERDVRQHIGQEVRFNHAMLNLYEDGSVYIGKHSDNLENRVIVTVSLGAQRSWIMTRKPPRGAKAESKRSGVKLPKPETRRWPLENGSLLVMQGDCQKEWYHEIPREKGVHGGRISITFRQLVYE